MLSNYLKIAYRNLLKSKVYSVVNAIGLSTGLAACLAIGLYIQDEYSHDRFHRNFEHLYRLTEVQTQEDGQHPTAATPGPLAPALLHDFPEVANAVRVGQWGALLQRGTASLEAKHALVAENAFFQMFDFPLLEGNAASVLNSPNEVVISESAAEQLFGTDWRDSAVVGKTLMVNTETPFNISGVAANPPAASHLQFDVLIPFKYLEATDEWSNRWGSNNYHTYLQLQPTADPVAFGQKIERQLAKYHANSDATLHLQPLAQVYLHSKFDFGTDWGKRGDIFYVRVLLAVGLVLLLIAVANFINLTTARSSARAREVGVRKSAGASRGSLIGQFLVESQLLTTLSVAIALLLTHTALPWFETLADKKLHLPLDNPQFLLALGGFTLLVGLLAGAYPAFYLSRFRPSAVLKGTAAGGSGNGRFRQALVVGQFVLSGTLGIGTLVIYQQLHFLQHKKLGFDQSQLLYVELKGDTRDKAAVLKAEVAQLPGVVGASSTTTTLVDVGNSSNFEWEGQQSGDGFLITQMNVDADFLPVTGLSLVSGRNFSANEPSDTSDAFGHYLVNETAARRMGYTAESALGKRVKFWGFAGEIIGVVGDFHFRPLNTPIEPSILRCRPKESFFNVLIKTQPGDPTTTIAALEQAYRRLDASHPFTYGFVNEDLNTQYQAERRTGQVVLFFAVLTILVSCLGLFGLATFVAEQRTKEIGVRKVLGASVASVVGLLSKDFLKLVLVALAVATPLAWWLMRQWLADYAYRIEMRWWMFAGVGAVALLIAFVTVSFQSVKAALANPVQSLRNE